MPILYTLVNIELLDVHAPNGNEVFININEITTLRQPTKFDIDHFFPKFTRCVVVTTTGKFVTTRETCLQIRDMILRKEKPQ